MENGKRTGIVPDQNQVTRRGKQVNTIHPELVGISLRNGVENISSFELCNGVPDFFGNDRVGRYKLV